MNEFKVGLMAIATMIAAVFMSLKITSNQSGFGEYVTYKTILTDASGIFPKTPIKVAGINAGRIKKIELDNNEAYVTFEVLKKVPVSEGSVLRIKTVGFLGDKFLSIHMIPGRAILKEGSIIPSEDAPGINNLVQETTDILVDVKEVVKSLREAMAPADGPNPIKEILSDSKKVAENFKAVSISLKNIFEDEHKYKDIVSNFQRVSEELAYQVDSKNSDSFMSDIKGIKGVLANLDEASKSANEIIANIKNGKGTIGKLLVEDKIADEVSATLASVQRVVGKVDEIRTNLSVFIGGSSEQGSATDIDLEVWPSPERFYSLGVSNSEYGIANIKETTTTVDGVSTTVETNERKKDEFKFNIQLGRRFNNWSLRGGLIESSGGVGVDYYQIGWGSKFSFDVYDYRDGIGPNLRLSSQIRLWNVFYGKVAFEDMIADTRGITLSAGLNFTDEDLKGILAFFF
ncbi:MAG: MCE family protein [Halobacteriovoraceae bacterium]|nr:MCE family protein [Halobacteriovoraceae bacterium]